MNATDHERCSELLADHVQGRLVASEQAWVADHLSACPQCRAEETALRALAPAEVAPLTEIERARLRRGVLALGSSRDEIAPVVAPAARGGRLLQMLGAAALMVMIGGFLYTTGLTGGDDAGGDRTATGEAGRDMDAEGAPAALEDGALEQSTTSGSGAGGSEAAFGPPPPEPTFRRSLGAVTGKRLNKLGREGLPLVVFSRAYRVPDVADLQGEFREQLALAAGERADSVRTCSDLVTDAFPNSLPAYGALATLEKLGGDEVLVLAFAWTDETSGPLDQSMVWAWPADDCDRPVEYYKNVIRPQQ